MCYSKEGKLLDRREMLRVKVKSLAEEARIIRREERRARFGDLRGELHWHRISDVRLEARATHIAYGLVKGLPIERIEKPRAERPEHLWKKIRAMVEKYGPVDGERRTQVLALCR